MDEMGVRFSQAPPMKMPILVMGFFIGEGLRSKRIELEFDIRGRAQELAPSTPQEYTLYSPRDYRAHLPGADILPNFSFSL